MASDKKPDEEIQADMFAAELLMPERLMREQVAVFDQLLESDSHRIQAFTSGVLIDILFQAEQNGVISRSPKPNPSYFTKWYRRLSPHRRTERRGVMVEFN
jgi:Zn-dependent peptidase ImmA (M78 family)